MRYALIKNGVVENVIEADQAFVDLIAPVWDLILPNDTASPGWTYADETFTPPAPVPVDPLIQQKANIAFGQEVMAGFAILNDQRGLTSDQKYQLAQSLSGLVSLLSSGDLKTVLAILPSIPVDGVLLTQDIINAFMAQISAYLASLG